MAYLLVAVIVAGLLGATNLLLTLAVIRRLREHAILLSAQRGASPQHTTDDEAVLAVGGEHRPFSTTTVDGVSIDRLAGSSSLVAFVKPDCRPCREGLPRLVDLAATMPGGPEAVLAVVIGDDAQTAEMAARLRPVARVVVETVDGPVSTAFRTTAYPTYYRMSGPTVSAVAHSLAALGDPVSA